MHQVGHLPSVIPGCTVSKNKIKLHVSVQKAASFVYLTSKFVSIQCQEKETIMVYINDFLSSRNTETQMQVGNSEAEGR